MVSQTLPGGCQFYGARVLEDGTIYLYGDASEYALQTAGGLFMGKLVTCASARVFAGCRENAEKTVCSDAFNFLGGAIRPVHDGDTVYQPMS